ncbi:hypothetical protein ACNPM4_01480, partial [Microbacterium sp. AGC62]
VDRFLADLEASEKAAQ